MQCTALSLRKHDTNNDFFALINISFVDSVGGRRCGRLAAKVFYLPRQLLTLKRINDFGKQWNIFFNLEWECNVKKKVEKSFTFYFFRFGSSGSVSFEILNTSGKTVQQV